jgi:hypothetical protein
MARRRVVAPPVVELSPEVTRPPDELTRARLVAWLAHRASEFERTGAVLPPIPSRARHAMRFHRLSEPRDITRGDAR